MIGDLIAVRQEVNDLESSVVVQELEFAMQTNFVLVFTDTNRKLQNIISKIYYTC